MRRVSNHLMESPSTNSTTGLPGTDEKSNNAEGDLANGVTEYELNRVFTPADSQANVYNSIAAPIVDGIFPSRNTGDTFNGNSALHFSSGITNATSNDDYTAINAFRSQLSKPLTNVISTKLLLHPRVNYQFFSPKILHRYY